MKTLLMLTDFSATARHAATYLAGFAAQVNAERILLYHSYRKALPDRMVVTDVLAGSGADRVFGQPWDLFDYHGTQAAWFLENLFHRSATRKLTVKATKPLLILRKKQ